MIETKLKPCPFCGGKVRLESSHGFNYVLCKKCKSEYYPASFGDGKKVVSAWNARPIEEDLDKKNGYLIGTCHDLHDLVEDFRAECDQKDLEIKRLREALEVILDAAQKDEPCVLAIKAVAYTALKGDKE